MEQQAAVNVIDADQAGTSGSAGPRPVGKHAPGPPVGIRNVALVGHNGSGKTTLAEALLFATGAITRQGKVDDGSTVSDFEPEEIKYHMSLSLALAPCTVGEVKLNIIDTPGYRRLLRRGEGGLLGGRLGGRGGERGGGRRGADRGRLGPGRRAGSAPPDLRQQARPGPGQLRPHPASISGSASGRGSAPLELPIGRRVRPPRGSPTSSPTPLISYESGKPRSGPGPERPGRHRARGP